MSTTPCTTPNPPVETPLYGSDTMDSMTPPRRLEDDNLKKCMAEEMTKTKETIQKGMEILTELWDEVHMHQDTRMSRVQAAYQHLRNLVDDMVTAETEMVETVKKGIHETETMIKQLRQELRMEEWKREHVYPSIALLRAAEKEEEELREKLKALMAEQDKFEQRMHLLCYRLGKNPLNYLPAIRTLLSPSSLENLQNEISTCESELSSRLQQATRMQKDLRRWYRVLGKVYGDHEEPDLNVFLDENLSCNDFQLTTPVMQRLEQFWNELSAMYKSWLEEMDMEWTSCYEELKELWRKCHVEESEQKFPARFDPSSHTQDDVDRMVTEIVRLTTVFAARQPVYKLLEDWKSAWRQKMNLGERKKEADYYSSRERGRNLMRDVQLERHLDEVRLPTLKKSLAKIYEDYKKSNPTDKIRVDGYEPLEMIEWMETEYNLDREREKTAKSIQRKQIFQRDGLRTPVKVKVGIRTPATPAKISEKRPRLSPDALEVSIIGPVRSHEIGPKTSSPKKAELPVISTPKRINYRALPRRL